MLDKYLTFRNSEGDYIANIGSFVKDPSEAFKVYADEIDDSDDLFMPLIFMILDGAIVKWTLKCKMFGIDSKIDVIQSCESLVEESKYIQKNIDDKILDVVDELENKIDVNGFYIVTDYPSRDIVYNLSKQSLEKESFELLDIKNIHNRYVFSYRTIDDLIMVKMLVSEELIEMIYSPDIQKDG